MKTMTMLRLALTLAGGILIAGCGVEVGPEYPVGYYDYPPDGYIATTEPVYFEGRPAYWYGNRWYYRDGGRWSYYHSEPRELYGRRVPAAPPQRVYEAPRVRATPRVGGGGGGRAGHGGHR